jgi:lipopolysaccharide transport system ATP-binding protein
MSNKPAIAVRHLSKVYDLGLSGRSKSLATIFRERVRHPIRGGSKRDRLVALDDVSFDVTAGEAVGVIGNNGAGKSTLLKIISRITSPTTGYIDMVGRVGALLEVGTGFHPELTGMENIYMNGSVLGMAKRDIDRRLDEIVAFSEIEKFLNTPTKRYSTGMRVRLAFAVAAHLEPEILIVDEVLSVGDFSFQAKCLEKMRSVVTDEGRTVLFVSHNLVTVEHFCPRSIMLADGHVVFDGPTQETIATYMRTFPQGVPGEVAGVFDLEAADRSDGRYEPVLKKLEFRPNGGLPSDEMRMGEPLRIEIGVEGLRAVRSPFLLVTVGTATCPNLFRMTSSKMPLAILHRRSDRETIVIDIPYMPLTPGEYFMSVHLKDANSTVDFVLRAATFTVTPADVYGNGFVADPNEAYFIVPFEWEVQPSYARMADNQPTFAAVQPVAAAGDREPARLRPL